MLDHDQIKVPLLEDNKACQTRQHNMKEKTMLYKIAMHAKLDNTTWRKKAMKAYL